MADSYTQDTFRGLLVPDARLTESTLDVAASSFTEAGAQAGIPEPQVDTELNLQATGTQLAGSQLRIATQVGGYGDAGRAAYRWQREGETTWKGHNTPNAITSWRAVQWTDGTPVAPLNITATYSPHAVTLADETVLVAYHADVTGVNDVIFVSRISVDGTITTGSAAYTSNGTPPQGLHPCLVVLPSGRVQLYHYITDTNTDRLQVAVKYSDDNGATWGSVTDNALGASIDVSAATAAFDLNQWPARGLRVAYSNGQLLMMIGVRSNDLGASWRDYFLQYASDDQGNHFELVEDWSQAITASLKRGCRCSIEPATAGFDVFYIDQQVGGNRQRRIGNAYAKVLSDGEEITISDTIIPITAAVAGNTFSDADLATVTDDSGAGHYLLRHQVGAELDVITGLYNRWGFHTARAGFYTGQSNLGTTNLGAQWNGEDSNDTPTDIVLAAQAGRILMFHNWRATTGNEDNSLGCAYLGGYSDITLPTYQQDNSQLSRLSWQNTWLPIERPPDGLNWNHATAGVNADVLQAGAVNISTLAGNSSYYRTPAGTTSEGIAASFGVAFVASGAIFSYFIRALFTLEDGAAKHALQVGIRDGVVQAYDTVAAASVGQLTIQTTAPGVEIMVFMNNGKASVYARSRDYAPASTWQVVCSGATLASAAGGGTSEIRWGHTPASTAESNWYWFNYASDEYACQVPAAAGFTNPADLSGRAFGQPTYVADGVTIRAVDGPTMIGDSWNIDTRYDYRVIDMLPAVSASPARGWHSVGESLASIIWDLSGPVPSNVLGLHLKGLNWKTGTLYGWNTVTAAWVSLAPIDTSSGQTAIPLKLVGDTYIANQAAGAVSSRYISADEMAGGTLELGGGVNRQIASNTAGVMTNLVTQKTPAFRMATITGAEPANAAVDIWSPEITIIMHDLDVSFTKLKLEIDANQNTQKGYYTVGTMAVGPVHLFSQDYSWGRIQESQPNTELVTFRDGTRSAFKRGSARRSVQFGWLDGVDISSIQGQTPTPDYVLSTSSAGALPVGYRGDTPDVIRGLVESVNGAEQPVVYLPSVPAGTPDVVTIQGAGAALYGRIITGVTHDTLLGAELSEIAGEVVKVSNLTIEGEV